jgi:hypothetical protein
VVQGIVTVNWVAVVAVEVLVMVKERTIIPIRIGFTDRL